MASHVYFDLDGTLTDPFEGISKCILYAVAEQPGATLRLMIGDRKHDLIAATANDTTPIGVSYGYGSVDELKRAGAVAIAHQPRGSLINYLSLWLSGYCAIKACFRRHGGATSRKCNGRVHNKPESPVGRALRRVAAALSCLQRTRPFAAQPALPGHASKSRRDLR